MKLTVKAERMFIITEMTMLKSFPPNLIVVSV